MCIRTGIGREMVCRPFGIFYKSSTSPHASDLQFMAPTFVVHAVCPICTITQRVDAGQKMALVHGNKGKLTGEINMLEKMTIFYHSLRYIM